MNGQSEELRLERLVAHRELQLVRAEAKRGRRAGPYIAIRQKKLNQAKKALARLQGRAGEVA